MVLRLFATGKGFSVAFRRPGRAVGHQEHSAGLPRGLGRIHAWTESTTYLFGSEDAKVVFVDTTKLEIVRTVALESKPTLNGYITPDPSGKYLYASVETGLQVIDTNSLQVVETIRIGGVVGTPFLLK